MKRSSFLKHVAGALLTKISTKETEGGLYAFESTLVNNGGPALRLLIEFQPAGRMEEWFHQVSNGTIGKQSEAEQTAQSKAHGFERSGPAIDYLKKY